MAVAFDAVSSATVAASAGGTLSWTHTPSGTPTAVGVVLDVYTGGGSSVSGVTYGGQAMATPTNGVSATIGIGSHTEVWGLANPPSGAQTVTITFSAASGNYCNAGGITVTGSDTTTCFSAANSNNGISAAPTVTITGTAVGEFVIDIAANDSSDATLAVGGSQTLRWGPLGTILQAAGSSLPGAATNTTMSWTCANEAWAMTAASFKAAGAATLIRGWDYIQDDIYPKRALGASAAPAFVSTFTTAGIAGIAWSGPRDHAKLPPSVVFSAPPAFARPIIAAAVPISGMAWDTLHENDKLPKGRFLTEPAPLAFIPQTSTWSFLVGDTTFLRDPPVDSPPGYGHAAFVAPVGISGMAWFTPLDWSNPRVTFSIPPAYAVNVAPVVNTNAGIPWFEPPDRDRPATRISVEAPIAYVRPPVVFTPISGIAWHEPLDLITVKPSFSYPPAFGRPIAAPVAISGMAWFEPPPCTVKLQVSFSEAPALQQPIVQLVTIGSKRRPTLFIANLGRMMGP